MSFSQNEKNVANSLEKNLSFPSKDAILTEKRVLSVPYFPKVELQEDGIPSENFWKNAAVISEFQKVYVGGDYGTGTEVRLCRDPRNLYVALFAQAPQGTCIAAPGKNCWAGDNIEVFLAGRTKHGWNLAQMVLGSNGSVYSERISNDQWKRYWHTENNGWTAELVIPFDSLRLDENNLYFNVLNRRQKENFLTLTWCKLPRFAHEPDCFAKLDFSIPDKAVTHGPWTFRIKQNQAGIAWETAAACEGVITVYPKGHPENSQKIYANDCGGAPSRSSDLHSAIVYNLLPDTEYIYLIGDGKEYCFRTLSKQNTDFSFAVTSDIHSHVSYLDTALQREDVRKCDLFFALGDQLTGSMGREALYEGFLDSMLQYCKMPFYVIRGNHEYRGPCPETVFECFNNGIPKDYDAFSHKGIFFVLLDGDGDSIPSEAYIKQETQWLQQIVQSPDFLQAEYRVLLTHKPLCILPNETREIRTVLSALSQESLAKFDLNLAGHIHNWGYARPGDTSFTSDHSGLNGLSPLVPFPFPTFVNGAGTVMILYKNEEGLQLQWKDQDNPILIKKNPRK